MEKGDVICLAHIVGRHQSAAEIGLYHIDNRIIVVGFKEDVGGETNDITFFHMPDHPSWHVAASYKRNSYLSKPARLFIQMVKEHWNNNPFDRPNRIHLADIDLPVR